MEITVHFDSLDGSERTYQTCDINWGVFSTMPEYYEVYTDTKTFPGIDEPVKCKAFYNSAEGDFGFAVSGLPTTETDTNTLNNYANTFTLNNGVFDSDYYTNTANYEPLTLGVMPDDWGSNPHYMRFVYTYSSLDNKSVRAMIPVSMNEPWNMNEQYYLDKTGKMVQLICLPNNYKFATSKGYTTPAVGMASFKGTICGGAYTFEPFNTNEPYRFFRTSYVLTQDINGSTDISMSKPDAGYSHPDWSLFMGANLCRIADNTFTFNIFISTDIAGDTYLGVMSMVYNSDTQKYTHFFGFLLSENFWTAGSGRDPGNWGDASDVGGGAGTFTPTQQDDRGDASGIELSIDITARNSSMSTFFTGASGYKLHQINPADMQPIFAQLYSTNYFQNWLQSFFNPLSAVLTLHLIPQIFQSVVGGAQSPVKSQLTASGYNISRAISQADPPEYPELNPIVHKNIGSHSMERYFDAFPDFAPYTKCYLHLPYIGVQEIDVNAIAHGTIAVDYVCDVLNGNLAAYVWCQDREGHCTYKYCASGNCAYSIPLFANAQDGSALGKLISSGVGFTAGLATGNAGAIIGGVMGAADAAGAMLTRSTQVQGQFGSNAGMIMDTECFLEIIRPAWIEPETYRQLRGLPAMMAGTLLDDGTDQHQPYYGYVRAVQIETDQIDGATDEERSEIETIITNGIYIKQ